MVENFAQVEAFVEHLLRETQIAIAYKTMCQKLHEDERIPEVYDNTFEAHGFNLARHGVLNSFALCLTRLNEKQDKVASLSNFFEIFDRNHAMVSNHILEGRRKWVQEDEALVDTEIRMSQLADAQADHEELLATHLWARAKSFRHKFLAHNALDADNFQFPKFGYLYELCDKSTAVVAVVCQATIGLNPNLKGHENIWADNSDVFFESIIKWAK